jgi:hypothetical protein
MSDSSSPLTQRLPTEVGWAVSRRSVIATIVGALLALFLLNLGAYALLRAQTTNRGSWVIRQKWGLLRAQESPVGWLILGDSSCNQGVMPALFEAELGQSAINLCTIGNGTAIFDLWMIEDHIQRLGPPQNVIIVHAYDVWPRGLNPGFLAEPPLPWRFWRQYSSWDEIVTNAEAERSIFIERYLPLYSQTRSLSSMIRAAILEFDNPFSNGYFMQPDGFMPAAEAKPIAATQDARDHINAIAENGFFISHHNQLALDRIAELADQYGFEVYLANSPMHEMLYFDPNFQVYWQTVQAQLAPYAAQSAHLHYVEPVFTFPAEQLQTADHLIVSGAETFTRLLIAEIERMRQSK